MFLGCCGGRPVPANSNGSVCVCSLFVCVFPNAPWAWVPRSDSQQQLRVFRVQCSTNSFLHVFLGDRPVPANYDGSVCVCVFSVCVCVCVSASECSVGLGSPKRFAAAALCVSCVVQQLFFAAAALSPQNDPCAFALAPNARFCWGCGVISLVFGR